MRRAHRIDATQPAIVQALRGVGWIVRVTSMVGDGFPDLVASKQEPTHRRTIMFEVKDGSLPPSARKLTPAEEAFRKAWKGELYTVGSVEEALAVVFRRAA